MGVTLLGIIADHWGGPPAVPEGDSYSTPHRIRTLPLGDVSSLEVRLAGSISLAFRVSFPRFSHK